MPPGPPAPRCRRPCTHDNVGTPLVWLSCFPTHSKRVLSWNNRLSHCYTHKGYLQYTFSSYISLSSTQICSFSLQAYQHEVRFSLINMGRKTINLAAEEDLAIEVRKYLCLYSKACVEYKDRRAKWKVNFRSNSTSHTYKNKKTSRCFENRTQEKNSVSIKR